MPRPATLRNRENKQVEFLRATGVKAKTLYVYRGAQTEGPRYSGWNPEMIRNDRDYGTQSNPKVWVMREFTNSEENACLRNIGKSFRTGSAVRYPGTIH